MLFQPCTAFGITSTLYADSTIGGFYCAIDNIAMAEGSLFVPKASRDSGVSGTLPGHSTIVLQVRRGRAQVICMCCMGVCAGTCICGVTSVRMPCAYVHTPTGQAFQRRRDVRTVDLGTRRTRRARAPVPRTRGGGFREGGAEKKPRTHGTFPGTRRAVEHPHQPDLPPTGHAINPRIRNSSSQRGT